MIPQDFSVEKIIADLNAEQREAVEYPGGPLAIVAGAGTGKTRVITYRIAYLIAAKITKPNQILALTFTDKAAAEMEERVDLLVPYGYTDVTISTFHSFGDRLVREFAVDLGLDSDFKLLSSAEQALFLREHLFELPLKNYRPLGNPTKFLHELSRHFSRLKDEDISPAEYLAFSEKSLLGERHEPAERRALDKQLELAHCYEAYQELMARGGYVDFGDQIALCTRLLREHPDVRDKLQQRYQYIFVDEFQDTNYAQFQLVKELAAGAKNLTVVADDDQSIYKFRGAALSNILNFDEAYPGAHYVVLTKNYRSTQAILDASYRLIRQNDPDRLEVKRRINKKLAGRKPGGKAVEHLHFDTLSTEAQTIAQGIAEKVSAGVRRYSDYCLLVRSNGAADPYLHALAEARVPFRFSGNRGLFQREEIRLLIAFMRVLVNPEDAISLYHLAQSDIYRMPMADLQKFLSKSHESNRSLLGLFRNFDDSGWEEAVSLEGRATIAKVLADYDKYLAKSRELPAYALLYSFLKESGYLQRLIDGSDLEGDAKIRNLAKFFLTVQNYAHFTDSGNLAFFVKHLDLMREFGDDPGMADADLDAEAVHVMTVHKAKGLEFPIVFVVGLVDQKFPTPARRSTIELPEGVIKDHLPEGDFHLQEERRLFYVAMTRAQQELYLTSSRDHGGSRPRKVSRFVQEAIDAAHTDEDYRKTSPLETLARFDIPAPLPTAAASGVSPESQPLALDPHKIDDYLTCPLKYKYIHVLRVPLHPHHSVIYGQAIHAAIKEYNQRKKQRRAVSSDDLLRVFQAKWRNLGFVSREHEDLRFARGQEVLKNFFAQQENEKRIPVYVEEGFHFQFENMTIAGRWDRVDEIDGQVYITDYKASEVDDQDKASTRAKESKQLRIYAWAYQERFARPVNGWRLHFLESGVIGEATLKERYLEKVRADVREAAAGIRSRDYHPEPSAFVCPHCAFQDICPAAERE
ncbi:MAG: ATP-dependent helicase [bacterium]